MMLEVSQEDAAVLNAIRQVRESTGSGRVVVEVKDGQIIFIGNSQETPIPPGLPPAAPPDTFWLRCPNKNCRHKLARIDIFDGWQCLRIGLAYTAGERTELVCPRCHTVKVFYARRVL